MEDLIIRAEINPLLWLQGEDHLKNPAKEWNPDCVLDFAVQRGFGHTKEDFLKRYKKIREVDRSVIFMPSDETFLQRLAWPLKNAKASFLLANYLGTIALCGYVAEMLAVLLFQICKVRIGSVEMTVADQKRIFGNSFEGLDQRRRIEVLRGYGIIDEDTKGLFTSVRKRRNGYLHRFSVESEGTPENDALEIYSDAISLFLKAIGQELETGKIKIRPEVVNYLRENSVVGLTA